MAEFPQNMHKHRHIQAVKWGNPNTRQDGPTLAQWPATVVIEKRWENSPLTRGLPPPAGTLANSNSIYSHTHAYRHQYTIWQTVVIEKRWGNSPLTEWAAPPCRHIGQQMQNTLTDICMQKPIHNLANINQRTQVITCIQQRRFI